jgi:ribose-phosphate pyrophosphokinase
MMETMMDDFIIFSGKANPGLAASVALQMGVRLGSCETERFPDGELTVRLNGPVRRKEVFIIQPTSPPVNENLIELLAFSDACRRSSASRITAVIPYFGYARSDKRHGRREPINASMVAELLQAVGIDHVITLDLHAPQIEGFFHIPVDSLTAVPTLADVLKERIPPDAVVVSPDVGRVRMATRYAQRLGASVVVLHKQRESGTQTRVTNVVGDVQGKACLIIDDMISTGGTIAESIEALLDRGARPEITVAATHGPLLEGAREKLDHEAVREIYVTDTISNADKVWPKLKIVSIAPLVAGAIHRFMIDGSFSDLY